MGRGGSTDGDGGDGDADVNGDEDAAQDARDLTKVEYQLNSLLFFGRCLDLTDGTPTNGLQLTLLDMVSTVPNASVPSTNVEILPGGSSPPPTTTANDQHRSTADTLVMKTVGYW